MLIRPPAQFGDVRPETSAEEAGVAAPCPRSMYDACLRNQYLMPPFKDTIVTRNFMLGVKDKFYWCLRSNEVTTLKVCADPPRRIELALMVFDVIMHLNPMPEPFDTGIKRTALLIKQKPPSVNWMIMILSSLNPDHAIFAKNYVRPKEQRQKFAA